MDGDIHEFETGAKSSADARRERYDLISPVALKRLAMVYAEGCKYGERNWEKGQPVSDHLNRAIRHIFDYLDGRNYEDDLGHAAWRLFAALHFEKTEFNDVRPAEIVDGEPKDYTKDIRIGSPLDAKFQKEHDRIWGKAKEEAIRRDEKAGCPAGAGDFPHDWLEPL